jgi:signal transduction histidine kinase
VDDEQDTADLRLGSVLPRLMHSVASGWQNLFGRFERARDALSQVESDRDDTITYLSTLKVVMEILGRAPGSDQACQEIAEALLTETNAETCVLAVRDRPDDLFRLRGFANQSRRFGEIDADPENTEATWLTTAALVAAAGRPTFYRRWPDGTFTAMTADAVSTEGLLGLPFQIGGESNGVLILEYLTAPAHRFAHGRAVALVAEIIGGALTVARMRDAMAGLCVQLEHEVGVSRDAISAQERSLRAKEEHITRLTASLIRSNQVKREFLGTLSHELRTPLNAIVGYSALLHDGFVGSVAPEQRELLDRVMVNTRNLNQLIDDMLFFVQLGADQMRPQRQSFSLSELVTEVANALPERLGRSEATFRVEIAPGLDELCCDRSLLKRALFHLLLNGFKFTPEGEVVLSAAPWAAGRGIVVTVQDTGIGIPQVELDHVFEAFHQVDPSTTRRFTGVGIGLALVRRCIEILGGEVDLRSTPNVGSEFTVHIPDTEPEAVSAGTTTQLH